MFVAGTLPCLALPVEFDPSDRLYNEECTASVFEFSASTNILTAGSVIPGPAAMLRMTSYPGKRLAGTADTAPGDYLMDKFGKFCPGTEAPLNSTIITLDGIDDFLSSEESDAWNFGTSDFTIDFWAKFARGHRGLSALVSSVDGKTYDGYFLGVVESSLAWYHQDTCWIDTGFQPLPDQWYHIAVVRRENVLKMFINGQEKGRLICARSRINTGGSGLVIGRAHTNTDKYYFQGSLNAVRITKGTGLWFEDFTPPDGPVGVAVDVARHSLDTQCP